MSHSPAKSALDVGSVIGGTYTIEGLLGRGGMGAVFAAGHARLPGKKVAIKVLHAEVATDESLARFRREAEIASRLGHPNIVEVHDFNVLPDGTPYLVLEYLAGESLGRRLERGSLSLDETFAIVRQVASALAAAHREGIVHRDLKPQNVFLVPTEVDGHLVERAKVLDFGISKIRGSQTVKTQDTAILGTPQYMAPEQATGNHAAVDARTDVFALGVMIYEMLSGEPAFTGASIPEVVFKVVYEEPVPLASRVPGLPRARAAAVHRAMAKTLDDRFPSVAELVLALTGAPLATARRPVAIAPGDGTGPSTITAGDSNVKTNDAFAQTIGSGDHAPQIGLGTAQTMASGDHGGALPTSAPARAATTAAPGGVPVPMRPAMMPSAAPTAAERRSARDRRSTGESAAEGGVAADSGLAGHRTRTAADAAGEPRAPAPPPATAAAVPPGREVVPEPAPPRARTGRRWFALVAAMFATGAAVAFGYARLRPDGGAPPVVAMREPLSAPAAPTIPAPPPPPAAPPPSAAPAHAADTVAAAPPAEAEEAPPPVPEPEAEAIAAAEPAPDEESDRRPSRRSREAKGSAAPDSDIAAKADEVARAAEQIATDAEARAEAAAKEAEAAADTAAEEVESSDPLAAQLAEAELALRDDPEAALRLAKRILNQRPGNAQAWSIRARAHCRLDDREAAVTALRKLEDRPRIRRRAAQACKAAGLDL